VDSVVVVTAASSGAALNQLRRFRCNIVQRRDRRPLSPPHGAGGALLLELSETARHGHGSGDALDATLFELLFHFMELDVLEGLR
jgi:hypothetical protein